MMTKIGVGICGIGTVGAGTFNLLQDNSAEIRRRTGQDIQIVRVGCRKDPEGCDVSGVPVSRDIFEVANDPAVDILVELIGGTETALELVKLAVSNGKHVITANKALMALHGAEIFELAAQYQVQVKFEAAIAGGIPIVKSLREGLAANKIHLVAGIINGTSNFILTEMAKAGNRNFAEVLEEAQALGYAEADPTFDVEGIDAAHKLTLLSSIAFGIPLHFDEVFTEGISSITPEDIEYARELGYQIKHLGITREMPGGVELRVHPTLVPATEMLAQVDGVMNAVLVQSDAAGVTVYYGAGAGAGPTASAVVADIIDVVRGSSGTTSLGFTADGLHEKTILSIEEVCCSHYLNLHVQDVPGVLASISTILGQNNISIEALIQKDARRGAAAIVILTNDVMEADLQNALMQISGLPHVENPIQHIRVESFDD